MKPNFVSIGAACAAVGVVLGAFGAHALHGAVADHQLALWETATRYWFVGAFGLLGFGLQQAKRPSSRLPGILLLLGAILFSASLYALALGAPRGFGLLTPFGGLGLIAGFSGFAWAARLR
jgi:uncharacterized membrane protein YgdD (TMEM256/DUF423 family)